MIGKLIPQQSTEQRRILWQRLKHSNLTAEQKSVFCQEEGICETCGVKTHWIGPLRRVALTNEDVQDGVCKTCHILSAKEAAPTQSTILPSWEWKQKKTTTTTKTTTKTTTTGAAGTGVGVNGSPGKKKSNASNVFLNLKERVNKTTFSGDAKIFHKSYSNDESYNKQAASSSSMFSNLKERVNKTTTKSGEMMMKIRKSHSNDESLSGNRTKLSSLKTNLHRHSNLQKNAHKLSSSPRSTTTTTTTTAAAAVAAVDMKYDDSSEVLFWEPASTSSKETTNKPSLSSMKDNFRSGLQKTADKLSSIATTTGSRMETNHPSPLNSSYFQKVPEEKKEEQILKVGDFVSTLYGSGTIVGYRKKDQMYIIDLNSEKTQSTTDTKGKMMNEASETNKTMRFLFCKKETISFPPPPPEINIKRHERSILINGAYESLETMRRLNLELECHHRGIGTVDFDQCTVCLLNSSDSPTNEQQQEANQSKNFRRIRKLMKDQQKKRSAKPCLFCANPACSAHSSADFRKEGIAACLECVKFFEPDYIVECVNNAHNNSETHNKNNDNDDDDNNDNNENMEIDNLVNLYDRVLLLLQYSDQYIESIASALEGNTKTSNNVNIAGSSAGIVSGALGVAAAATIFTPAGPPLLVASFVLGGGATVAQTGTEAVNYYSEPNKFADRIIALAGMIQSLLKVKETLREVLTARLIEVHGNEEFEKMKKNMEELENKKIDYAIKTGTRVAGNTVLGSVAAGAASAASMESAVFTSSVEAGTLAGRNANFLSKSGTAVARGARFARFAGGALSAATLVLEAKNMSATIEQIRAGHPCEKADALRLISKEMAQLPTSKQLDEECHVWISAMNSRANLGALEKAMKLIEKKAMEEFEMTKAMEENFPYDASLTPPGDLILDGEQGADAATDDIALLENYFKGVKEERLAKSMVGGPVTQSESSNLVASADESKYRMSHSMTGLPDSQPSAKQISLLERIQKQRETYQAS